MQAQQRADDIIGYYFLKDPFNDEVTQIYIYKNSAGKYEGKVTWVDKEDKKQYVGLVFLKELVYNTKNSKWEDGTIKYPGKKGNFSVSMNFQDEKTLKVRGYWGLAMMGKTVYWTKENKKRE